jgi:ABC-2 type transport system permease protein
MKPSLADIPAEAPDAGGGRGLNLGGLGALFVLTLRQHLRGRRLLVLALLFLLPAVLVLIVRLTPQPPSPRELEFGFIFYLIPHGLATLTALLYAAGVIQDEVEEQTLTYLFVRPLPRWALYLTRLLATLTTTALLTGLFTTVTFVVIYWNTPELWGDVLPGRALKTAALLALAQAGYCALFGAISLWTRRALVVGVAYIIAFEGLLANFETVARRLTVMYYFRVLALRWLEPANSREWAIDLATAPSAASCVLTLLGASVVFALLGALTIMRREFRVKTPEGS